MYELQEQGHNLHIPVEGIAASRTPTPTTARAAAEVQFKWGWGL